MKNSIEEAALNSLHQSDHALYEYLSTYPEATDVFVWVKMGLVQRNEEGDLTMNLDVCVSEALPSDLSGVYGLQGHHITPRTRQAFLDEYVRLYQQENA